MTMTRLLEALLADLIRAVKLFADRSFGQIGLDRQGDKGQAVI